jgi:hypothetical protein
MLTENAARCACRARGAECLNTEHAEYLSVRPAFESLSASKLLPTLLEKFLGMSALDLRAFP